MKKPKGFGQYLNKAKAFVKDKQTILGLIQAVIQYAKNNKILVKNIKKDIQTLINLLRDWATGRYTEAPLDTILLIIAALIYFLSPIDLIPDFLGPIGFTDDAAFIGFVLKSIKKDIDRYSEGQQKKNRSKKSNSKLMKKVKNK